MKISYVFVALLITAMAFTGGVMFNETGRRPDSTRIKPQSRTYDPNDARYKFLAPASKEWVEAFGDSERTRVLYNLSLMRIALAQQKKAIEALQPQPPVEAKP